MSPKVFETQYVLKQIEKTKIIMFFFLTWIVFKIIYDGVYTFLGDIVYLYKIHEIESTQKFEVYLITQIIVNILAVCIHTWLNILVWKIVSEILNFLRDPRRGATKIGAWRMAGFNLYMFQQLVLNV